MYSSACSTKLHWEKNRGTALSRSRFVILQRIYLQQGIRFLVVDWDHTHIQWVGNAPQTSPFDTRSRLSAFDGQKQRSVNSGSPNTAANTGIVSGSGTSCDLAWYKLRHASPLPWDSMADKIDRYSNGLYPRRRWGAGSNSQGIAWGVLQYTYASKGSLNPNLHRHLNQFSKGKRHA